MKKVQYKMNAKIRNRLIKNRIWECVSSESVTNTEAYYMDAAAKTSRIMSRYSAAALYVVAQSAKSKDHANDGTTPPALHQCEPGRTQWDTYSSSPNYWSQGTEVPSCVAGDPVLLFGGAKDRNKRRLCNLKRAGDWWRQRNYSWEWCVPRGPGNNGGSGITNIRRRRRGIHSILNLLYETDLRLPAWFPAKWNVFVASCPRRSGSHPAQSGATRNLAWFLLPVQ
jgi:hypothetical protein